LKGKKLLGTYSATKGLSATQAAQRALKTKKTKTV